MSGFRSELAGGPAGTDMAVAALVPSLITRFPEKLIFFLQHGYNPHSWQTAFHFAETDDHVTRFRHLVAGRRGGKTLSAAWEVLFYALHPEQWWRDAKGIESTEPLWIWALAKDFKIGRPSLITFLRVLEQAGLIKDKDYLYNKTEKVFEFPNGTLLEFKTADDPQSLRGAGLNILWIDEAAMIPNGDAYGVVRPALSDKQGWAITTTTPRGKNWLWEMFWSEESQQDPNQFRIEYTSIDSPYFPRSEWEYEKLHMHPILFKQEYMAAFDAMHGVELQGDWLHYYTVGEPEDADDIRVPRTGGGKFDLKVFIGIDPAVSLADSADHFAMAAIGISRDGTQAFILETYRDKIPFPDQIDKIREWQLKWRPQLIGIESNAYQRALAQQAARLDGFPGIIPVIAKGKKFERILAMSPLFRIGKVRIHRKQADFIEEWVSYDSSVKNPNDDLLDAVEIALGVAGVLLPVMPDESLLHDNRPMSVHEEAMAVIRAQRESMDAYDRELGSEA